MFDFLYKKRPAKTRSRNETSARGCGAHRGDYLATVALESVDRLLERSHKITRGNLSYLSSWLDGETKLSWVKPSSGTTALIKIELPIKSYDFCV